MQNVQVAVLQVHCQGPNAMLYKTPTWNHGEDLTVVSHSAQSMQVTVLREHCQGPNAMLYMPLAGTQDPPASCTISAAAQAELSEEVQLPARP